MVYSKAKYHHLPEGTGKPQKLQSLSCDFKLGPPEFEAGC
jgi:hypothetical protein